MSIEERVTALERGLAATQKEFLLQGAEVNLNVSRFRKTVSEQSNLLDGIAHNETILLGLATEQQRITNVIQADVETIKKDVSILKSDVASIEVQLGRLETKVDEHRALLIQILE